MKNPVRIHEVLSKEFTAMTQSCNQSEQNQSKEKKLLVCEHGWKSRTHFVMASKGSAKQRIEHWANVPEKICYMFLCYKSVRKCTGHVVASKTSWTRARMNGLPPCKREQRKFSELKRCCEKSQRHSCNLWEFPRKSSKPRMNNYTTHATK